MKDILLYSSIYFLSTSRDTLISNLLKNSKSISLEDDSLHNIYFAFDFIYFAKIYDDD